MHSQVVNQNSLSLIVHGKGADATITDHFGRHSLQRLAFSKGMFKDAEIGMGVDINKTWGSDESIRFNDRFSSTFYRRRDVCDRSILNSNISPKGLLIRAIDDLRTPDEEGGHTNTFAISSKDVKQKFHRGFRINGKWILQLS
jgi:hypothetical protein